MKSNEKKRRCSDGPAVKSGSNHARKTAAVILEVLAGVLRPSEAARVLEVSLPRYYQLELRALEGLVKACEPANKGPAANPMKEVARLEHRIQRLQNECLRYQSLARAAGRAVGVTHSQQKETGKRKRKPAVRALKVAKSLVSSKEPQKAAKEVK